ncbi:hypothetical protein GW17_00048292 [Ensete ventricosum]|nr:hypothetical protein GW17_00048292 [Ensete ventricosum]
MAHGAAARVAEESSRNTWDHPLDRSYTISLPRHQETNGLVAGGMSASCCLSERYQLGSAPFPPHEAVISKHSIETDDIKGNKRRSQAECGALPSQSPEDRVQSVKAEEPRAASLNLLNMQIRREKISERMKLLQDLVPGCSKINGKAMMLDEIINYVQSLQRQVEVSPESLSFRSLSEFRRDYV